MEIRGNAWKYVEIHGNAWKYVEIHGNAWRYMEIRGDTWKYMEIHGNAWRYMEIRGDTWKCVEIHGNTWRYMEIHGNAWKCRRWSKGVMGPSNKAPAFSPYSGNQGPAGRESTFPRVPPLRKVVSRPKKSSSEGASGAAENQLQKGVKRDSLML
ncbi:MAG: hypothetical protein H6559_32640 [Lewinellaceae bacterium]|nr:hypothetical protein [Lewinellaceae bacterium]